MTQTTNDLLDAVNPDEGRYVTKEEYWARWYADPYSDRDVKYEWNNGRLEAKPSSTPAQIALYHWFFGLLEHYVQSYPIAYLIHLGVGFSMTMPDPEEPGGIREAVRRPDLGVILNNNPVEWGDDEYWYRGICDMCIESLSDLTLAEVYRDTVEKRRDYALAGVREYYILDPSEQHMHFYRRDAEGEYVEIEAEGGVIRSQVLPGFQFRWADLLQRPNISELVRDEMYGYVFPEYRVVMEARRADAEAAARRAETERVQALEAEIARLRRQGS